MRYVVIVLAAILRCWVKYVYKKKVSILEVDFETLLNLTNFCIEIFCQNEHKSWRSSPKVLVSGYFKRTCQTQLTSFIFKILMFLTVKCQKDDYDFSNAQKIFFIEVFLIKI